MSDTPNSAARRRFLGASSILLLGLTPGLAWARVIREMRGQVWINDEPANPDSPIQSGDEVRTGPDGYIVFVIGEDVYRLGGNARLRLEWDREKTSTGFLRLLGGALMSSFGEGDKRVRVPSATIGIRGTAIYLKVAEDHTYFCTCYGKTRIHTMAGENREVEATHHQAYRISHEASPRLEQAGMEGHQDEDVVAADQLVGRSPPARFLKPE